MKAVSLGALNGMLEAVDPYASYLTADQYRDYKEKDSKHADVGLILSKKFGYLGVSGHHPELAGRQRPAWAIATSSKDPWDQHPGHVAGAAQMLLQGDSGTSVELSVVRVRHPDPATIKLVRANVAAAGGIEDDARHRWATSMWTRSPRRS